MVSSIIMVVFEKYWCANWNHVHFPLYIENPKQTLALCTFCVGKE